MFKLQSAEGSFPVFNIMPKKFCDFNSSIQNQIIF